MTRIKIKDLPKDMKVSREEMKKIFGGTISVKQPYLQTGYYLGSDPYVINDPSPAVPPCLSEWFGNTFHYGVKK